MSSSQSYSDFERDCEDHLSKVRSFLASPVDGGASPNYAESVGRCESSLQGAKQCIHAMRGLAEIEGDPFKAEEAKRKLERDVGPLEKEIVARKALCVGGGGSVGSGISAVFKRSSAGGATNNSDEGYLFGNRRSYEPVSMGGEGDVESGQEDSLTAPLTAVDRRMQDSERLLRETQALCADTEQIGASTLETMGRQREQIERSSGLVQQSIENTQKAGQIMKEMARRALKNKIVLYCIIALLLLANGAAIVHLWRRKK